MPEPFSPPDPTQELPNEFREEQPSTSLISGFGTSVEEGFLSGGLPLDIEKFAVEAANPGKTVPHEDLPEGLGHEYKRGLGENVLAVLERQKAQDQSRQTELNQMTPGFLSGATKFAGSMIGNVLRPDALATAVLSPELLPEKLLGSSMAIGSARMTAAADTALRGSIEGSVLGGETGTANYHYQAQLGENPDPYSILTNAAMGGALGFAGGGLVGLLGKSHVMTSAAENEIRNTAVSQFINDKDVNVSPIISQEMYQVAQRDMDNGFDVESTQAISSELGRNIADADEALAKMPRDKDADLMGLGQLNKANALLLKDPMTRTESDNDFLSQIQQMDHYKDLINASAKNPLLRTKEESQMLDDFVNRQQTERDMINDQISSIQLKIADLNDKIPRHEKNPEDVEVLRSDLDRQEKKLKAYQTRKAQIKTVSELDRKVKQRALTKHKLQFHRDELSNLKDHHDAQVTVVQRNPVGKEDVERSARQIHSVDGDSFTDPDDEFNVNEEMQEVRDLEHYKNKAQDYADMGKIDQKDIDEIEREAAQVNKRIPEAQKVLDRLFECLAGEQ